LTTAAVAGDLGQSTDEGSPGVRFSVPPFCEGAVSAAQRVLRSGWVTTGPESLAFEAELAACLEAPHVVAVASCTHALELSLRGLRLPPGSLVFTPSLTFCGAVAAIVHAGYQPVLVDIDEDTLTTSEKTIAETVARRGRPAAIVVTAMAGYPVDGAAMAAAAGIPVERVIIDAAHGPGGDIGRSDPAAPVFANCLSFYATKNVPIGEGGAIATHDEEFAAWARSARLHGMSRDAWRRYLPGGSWRYDVPEVGFKCNMTDLQAAIGREQLRSLPEWQERRAELFTRYDAAFAELVARGTIVLPRRHEAHSLHLYQVRVRDRDAVAARLAEANIGTSVHFIPVHQLSAYAELVGPDECTAVPVTDRVADELLSLPLYPGLSDSDVDLVAERLTEILVRSEL
jgi:dTDP-4-amino-4,6-dideoxygalactose transaminase